jgi:hypothetical protein
LEGRRESSLPLTQHHPLCRIHLHMETDRFTVGECDSLSLKL